MTYFILSKVLQLPQESLNNKDTTLSSLAAENVIAVCIQMILALFTVCLLPSLQMSNTNKQNGEQQNKVSSSASLNQWGDVWNCLRLTASEAPWDAWPWHRGPRLLVPVRISIHNVHAGAFNHSYISDEIQLQTVINDGVLITANNWPSALWHTGTPWNSDPKACAGEPLHFQFRRHWKIAAVLRVC